MKDQRPTIVIAGGGTAGWMVAAAFARFLTGYRLRLIESDQIGTIGVGEATIPQIRLFKDALGIDEDALLKVTDGTFKLGIEFVGWRAPDHRYMHAFGAVGRDVGLIAFQHYWLRARALGVAKPLDAYALNEIAARKGRMHRGGPLTASTIPAMPYAYHFDAALFARMLRNFAEGQGVERAEGKILEVEVSEAGDVAALKLEGERRIDGDFFIDCTGFRALLIEQTLHTGFEDWSHWLPCDRALAVPSSRTEPLLPYTRATARAAGWQWRIPLQHRTGNGHVYCSAHMSDDEAGRILLETLDSKPIAEPRLLKFKAGRRSKSWDKNVVAIGLSAGFLEPLESTSIHLIQHAVQKLLALFPGRGISPVERDEFNRAMIDSYEPVRDFIILHYHATRRGGGFWDHVRAMDVPDTLKHKFELFREHGRVFRYNNELFDVPSWVAVMLGQNVTPRNIDPLADAMPDTDVLRAIAELGSGYEQTALKLPLASDYIERMIAAGS